MNQCLAKLWISIACPIFLVIASPLALGQTTDAHTIALRYDAGAAAFAAGLDLMDSDPTAARLRFLEAAATWQEIVNETDLQSGAMMYNIGNARLLGGQVGPAILAYRKAQRLPRAPRASLAANLAQARSEVETKVESPITNQFWRIALFWHHWVPASWRFGVFCAAFILCWLWLIGRHILRQRNHPLAPRMVRWPAVAAGIVSLVLLSSLLTQSQGWFEDRAGVVMRETTGRKGPSANGYGVSFSDPLSPGVEFIIIEDRAGWWHVRLADGRTTWVAAGDVSEV